MSEAHSPPMTPWLRGSQPMSTAVHIDPKIWRSNSIFNLWGRWMSPTCYSHLLFFTNIYHSPFYVHNLTLMWCPQNTHREATAAFWHIFYHDGKISPGWCGWRGCTPTRFHDIYHHVQSCSVRFSWQGRYTPPVSSLPLYTLCPPQSTYFLLEMNQG
jgi:hypothetical protein